MKKITIVAWFLVLIPVVVSAAIIHVPGDQPTIQDGIDVVDNGDTVIVADGNYEGEGNGDISLKGKAITVMSANGPDNCIITCYNGYFVVYHAFIFTSGENSSTIVQGFKIQGTYCESGDGGAIYCIDSSPIIRNCIINFSDMHSCNGGAVYCENSNLLIENTTIQHSKAGHGAGIFCSDESDVTVQNSILKWNQSRYYGGAIYCKDTSTVTIQNCEIRGNSAGTIGGGICCDDESSVIITSSIIASNTTSGPGGGIWLSGSNGSSIGGSLETIVQFENNSGAPGAHIYCCEIPEVPVSALFNSFTGCLGSHFYICPVTAFDLEGSEDSIAPIGQDVYVSLFGSNENDGLTPDTPFKTIHFALSRVLGDRENPVAVHLSSGSYSTTHLAMPQYVSLLGDPQDKTSLYTERGILSHFNEFVTIQNIHLENTSAFGINCFQSHHHTIQDCTITNSSSGLICQGTDFIIRNCEVRDNMSLGIRLETGSNINIISSQVSGNKHKGILCYENSEIAICNSLIMNNTSGDYHGAGIEIRRECDYSIVNCKIMDNYLSSGTYSGNWQGAGIYIGSYSQGLIANCTISGNEGVTYEGLVSGGGIYYASNTTGSLINCTIARNTLSGTNGLLHGGGIYFEQPNYLLTQNCIVWGNSPNQIYGDSVVIYSNIGNGYPGEGNIDASPIFLEGPNGYYFLSQYIAGQPLTSPCVNTGYGLASNFCFDTPDEKICLGDRSTSRDFTPDTGRVDMGAHYEVDSEIPQVLLNLNASFYRAGDLFSLDVTTRNPGLVIEDAHLYIILDCYGEFRFWPSWETTPDFATVTIPENSVDTENILNFIWPDNAGGGTRLYFWCGLWKNDGFVATMDLVGFSYAM